MTTEQQDLSLPTYLFHQGTNYRAYELLGCRLTGEGAVFRVWAPGAAAVSVTGDFNSWSPDASPMTRRNSEGLWECLIENIKQYDIYKYCVTDQNGDTHMKADPYAFHSETRPKNASKVYELAGYLWHDGDWLARRQGIDALKQPMNIYEVHLGSFRRNPDGSLLSYEMLADTLIAYVKEMGYTHIEIMPVTEHPFDGSWGYQVTGYFAPTSRYGTPHSFMRFVDRFHQAGIGVIMDWVPAHFPKDEHGLYEFDGGICYEYGERAKMENEGWGTRVFDFGKNEVRSFLISSAMFWFDKYHIDGLRVDAVASMIYLDYCREEGQWQPNRLGGRENLEAVELVRLLNKAVLEGYPGALMIAEESTAWPLVTKPPSATGTPPYNGGLGFSLKWNMGWMNDILRYIATDPLFRGESHGKLTFSFVYAFSENYVLPISHDEVVHGKCSLLSKMPGEYDQKFDAMRGFFAYMIAHPGKKLLFMGQEFGQFIEWNFKQGLDWLLLGYDRHRQLREFVKRLNRVYLEYPALWRHDFEPEGFAWIAGDDVSHSVISFRRFDGDGGELLCVCSFTPVERKGYRVGVPRAGRYGVLIDSGAPEYGGTVGPRPVCYDAKSQMMHGQPYSVAVDLAPCGVLYLRPPKPPDKG